MARSSRGASLVVRGRRLAQPGEVVVPWREVRAVVRATSAILRAHRTAEQSNAEVVIEIGRRVAAVRELLDHGEFLAWIREAIPFEVRTVQRYVALAAWADAEPGHARRLARLGPSKLYRVAALPRTRVAQLELGTPVPIPGGDGPKPLDTMTVAEFDRVIGDLAPTPHPPAPTDAVVAKVRHRLAGLQALAETLAEHADDIDEETAEELLEEVDAVAEALHDALD